MFWLVSRAARLPSSTPVWRASMRPPRLAGAPHVYGMQYGIEGVLEGKLIDLDTVLGDKMDIELLKRTPSSFLGSCRHKLPRPRR